VSTFPVIAKAISGGYDGRGVWKISDIDMLDEVIASNPQLLIEELINFDCEIAVMVARSPTRTSKYMGRHTHCSRRWNLCENYRSCTIN
jgi:phosphoribosylaminoimidazole carboxylase (NCAIR synthetase)